MLTNHGACRWWILRVYIKMIGNGHIVNDYATGKIITQKKPT